MKTNEHRIEPAKGSPPQPKDIGPDSGKVPDARKVAEAVEKFMVACCQDSEWPSVDELTKVIEEAMK